MPATSPQDRDPQGPTPRRGAPAEPPSPVAAFSVRDVLAACAAARTLCTPPQDVPAAAVRTPDRSDRDAA
jgi:hypothetical protein